MSESLPAAPPSRDQILAERAAVEAIIAGRTLADVVLGAAAEHGDAPAYSDKHGGAEGWRTLSWRDTLERSLDLAAGLVSLGVRTGDHVALMMANRNEHTLGDFGTILAAATPMSIYNTLSPEQVAFIAGESQPTVAILEDADRLARWEKALGEGTSVRHVVVVEEADRPEGALTFAELLDRGAEYRRDHGEEIDARHRELTPDDACTILYTSGTTGNPKGVVLTHRNVLYEAYSTKDAAGLSGPQRVISYLPLAHIAERILATYIPPVLGSHVHSIGDPAQLLATLSEVRPTAFFGVPRVWEKIKTGLSARLAEEPDPAKQAFVQEAMAAGRAWVQAQEAGGRPSPEVQAAYEQADAAILGLLRGLLGLDQVQWAASAAAPMPLEVAQFMAGLGLTVFDVYGLTETTGAVTSNGPDGFRLGTVGRANPGIEIALGEDGEVLVRGPVTTPGYYRNDAVTATLIDADGWVHTGDIGTLDDHGYLSIVDRKKELIITSAGKNVAPSNIENLLKESPIVGHAMAVGDNRPYVVAVLTLDGEIAPIVARKLGVAFTDLADLAEKAEIRAMVQQAVDAANARLSRPEQVKAWELLPTEWTAESDELTPTLKLKRRVVNSKYADVLDRLYAPGA
jgi:long-chain acyl-CoA synthetase